MSATILGDPASAEILVMADHASAALPDGIDLRVPEDLMSHHIAFDPGVFEVAEGLAKKDGFAAICARWSRLLVDLNRLEDDPAVLPMTSDGYIIPGNELDEEQKKDRLTRFHRSYHQKAADLIAENRPKLLINLHSFTPVLSSAPDEKRPWHVGILYGKQSAPSKRVIEILADYDEWVIGDQLPYSGEHFNNTMNRHAEPNEIPYIGVEMRQDMIADEEGQQIYIERIEQSARKIVAELASGLII